MTVILGTVTLTKCANGANAGAIIGAVTGLGLSTANSVGTAQTAGKIAGAVGASTSASAILGYVVEKELSGAITGLVSGSTAAAVMGLVLQSTGMVINIPIKLMRIILGTEQKSDKLYTFDCWKQVVHDESIIPSQGKLLGEIILDERIKNVETEAQGDHDDLPQLILKNIWDERFRIDYVMLPSNQLTAHAVKI